MRKPIMHYHYALLDRTHNGTTFNNSGSLMLGFIVEMKTALAGLVTDVRGEGVVRGRHH